MRRATVLFTATLLLATAMAGCLETMSSNAAPIVSFTISPSGTVKVGDTVTFDASGTRDPNNDQMTFEWNFGDDNTQEGIGLSTVTHTYNVEGARTIKLTVTDSGDMADFEEKTIVVASADAALPTASIVHYKDDDCTGDDAPAGTFILAWICEEEMETSDDTVDAMTTIQLDGSDSAAGDSSSYLTDYEWDLDINVDSDGDGDLANDVDKTGENAEWTNVWPGEYEIRLTVTDNQGFVDTMDMDVFVNYRGAWAEFTIDGNGTSGSGTITFEFPLTYNQDTGNTIRYAKIQFTYPKQDDDWQPGTCTPSSICANKLDAYVYNGTQSDSDTEEVANTTYLDDESRTAGDCSDDDRCIDLRLSTQHFRNYLDGQWTVDLTNEKA
ncbi:MAG: PKD domain-containing protein, partial [Candidatus Thalassarchaeaceae archaeon]|nr:PKD domain-containing protein [Candidatus Thalassarchaeaceae archaeon]